MSSDSTETTKSTTNTSSVLSAEDVERRGVGARNKSIDQVAQEIEDFAGRPLRLQDEFRSFFTVWNFTNRLPSPSWCDCHPGFLMRGMYFFPVMGTLIGYYSSVWFHGVYYVLTILQQQTWTDAGEEDPSFVTIRTTLTLLTASCASMLASFWLTGCFHEDGLADTADGFGGGWSRKQILKILTDSRVGTYGSASLMAYGVTRVVAVAAVAVAAAHTVNHGGATVPLPVVATAPVVLAHTYARWTPTYLMRYHDYIDDPEGPKTTFYNFLQQASRFLTFPRFLLGTLYTLSIGRCMLGAWTPAFVLLVIVLWFTQQAGRYADYVLGGVLGDYLGATICVTELLVYVLSTVLYPHALTMNEIINNTLQNVVNGVDVVAPMWETLGSGAWTCARAGVVEFVSVMVLVTLWKRNVGGPSVFVRDDLTRKEPSDKSSTPDDKKSTSVTTKTNSPLGQVFKLKGSDAAATTFAGWYENVQTYVDSLAKPIGSLGTLEEWATRWGALALSKHAKDSSTTIPTSINPTCLIFAADHGMAASVEDGGEACSAYPQVVTQSVLQALNQGVAGASVLARANGVGLKVIDVGVRGDRSSTSTSVVVPGTFRLPLGTRNACHEAAMTLEEVDRLLQAGRDAVREYVAKCSTTAHSSAAPLLAVGEVGIGNTTTSSLVLAALTGERVDRLVDGGAFLGKKQADPAQVAKKRAIVDKAMKRFRSSAAGSQHKDDTKRLLAELAGAEHVAMAGALLEAADQHIPVMVDGFIATTAALAACRLNPLVTQSLFLATQSTERGHTVAIQQIQQVAEKHQVPPPATPALAMHLRMGEGTGALLAVPMVQAAAAMIAEMATLQDILSGSSSS